MKPRPPEKPIRYGGSFEPPALGADVTPVPIAGPGHLTFTEEGLELEGFEPAGMGLRGVGYLLAVLVVAGGVTALRTFVLPDLPMWVVGVVAGVLGIALYRRLLSGVPHRAEAPVALSYAYADVVDARRDLRDEGLVVVRVLQGKARGAVHFRPAMGADALRAQLERRGVKVK
jgi:hypothetical protein